MNKKFRVTIASLLLAVTMHAQYKQQLRGTVLDIVLQKPLPGATVTIPSLEYSTFTDEEGVFRFKELPIGSYRMIISFSGFKEAIL